MNATELDKTAWQIYRAALRSVTLPENVKVIENADESFSFSLTLTNEFSGEFSFHYKPSIGLIKLRMLSEKCEWEQMNKGQIADYITQNSAFLFACALLDNFYLEITECFDNLSKTPGLAVWHLLETATQSSKSAKEAIKKFSAEKAKKAERRILAWADQFNNDLPPRMLIAFFYPALHQDWKAAKECYENNKQYKSWRKMVAAAFDHLPLQLIERFDEASPNFDSYAAMPSTIALEHAALICGVDVSAVETRTLHNYRKASCGWIEQVGAGKAAEAAKKYAVNVGCELIEKYRLAYLLGDERPERFTFFEQHIIGSDNVENEIIQAVKSLEEKRAASANNGEPTLH